ncbi:hypothetical protein [Streptomyces cacaoi]|uniref:hypothetical protein n=1 Tax=Streptomyces cacaoi TaxID=1898 RepID=UPI00374A4CD6
MGKGTGGVAGPSRRGLAVAVLVAVVLAAFSEMGTSHGSDDGPADRQDGRGERSARSDRSEHGRQGGERKEPAGAASRAPGPARIRAWARDPGRSCPVPYDMPAALRAAGVDRRPAPGSVSGETADDSGSPLARVDGALVNCGWTLGERRLRLYTVAVGKGAAVSVLLPQIQHDAGLSMSALRTFADRAGAARAGVPVLTPAGGRGGDGVVATVALPSHGSDASALVLSTGTGKPQLSRRQVRDVAQELAEQASRGDRRG